MSPASPESTSGAAVSPPAEVGTGPPRDTEANGETGGSNEDSTSSPHANHSPDGLGDDTTVTEAGEGSQGGEANGEERDAVPRLPSFASHTLPQQRGRTTQSQSMSALMHSSGVTRRESYESDSSLHDHGTATTTSTARGSQGEDREGSGDRETRLQRRRPPGARGLTESQSFSDLRLPKPNNPLALAARTHLANALDKLRGDISITPRKPQSGAEPARAGPKLVCYSCGEDWDVLALAGHLIDCPKQRRDAIARMPSSVPRPVMKLRKPDLPIPEESADVIDVLFYNMQSREIWEESFVDCVACKKPFPSTWDGIAKHVIEDCQRKDPKVPLEDVPVTPRSDRADSNRSRFESNTNTNANNTSASNNADIEASGGADTSTTTGDDDKRPSPQATNGNAEQGTGSPGSKQDPQTSPRERTISMKKTRASTLTDSNTPLGRARSTSTHEFAARALGVSPRGSTSKLEEAERSSLKADTVDSPTAGNIPTTTTGAGGGSTGELAPEEKEVTQQILSQALLETVSTIVTRTFGDRAPNKLLNFEAGFSSAHLPLSPLLSMGAGTGGGGRSGAHGGHDHTIRVQAKAAPLPIFRKGRDVNKVFPQVQARRTVYRRRKDIDPIAPLHLTLDRPGPGSNSSGTTALQQHWGGAGRVPPLNSSAVMTSDPTAGSEMTNGGRRAVLKPAVPAQPQRTGHAVRPVSIRALPTRASEANALRTGGGGGGAGEPRRPVVPLGTSQLQKRHHRNLRRRVGPPVSSSNAYSKR